MREEKHKFKSSELELAGVLTHPEIETKDCIILCHGLGVDKDELGQATELAHRLAEVGFAVFRFDFRCHGESQGNSIDLTITGEQTDIDSAVKFLQKLGFERFGIQASSFAAGPVVLYAAENQKHLKALCFYYPLLDYRSMFHPELPWPKEMFSVEQMNHLNEKGYLELDNKFRIGKALFAEALTIEPFKELNKLKVPVLFIHGNKDTYVPYSDSEIYSKVPEVSKLITIDGADHGFIFKKEHKEQAFTSTVNFFRQAFF